MSERYDAMREKKAQEKELERLDGGGGGRDRYGGGRDRYGGGGGGRGGGARRGGNRW